MSQEYSILHDYLLLLIPLVFIYMCMSVGELYMHGAKKHIVLVTKDKTEKVKERPQTGDSEMKNIKCKQGIIFSSYTEVGCALE